MLCPTHNATRICHALPGLNVQALPHARLEVAENASSAMHLECEGVVAVFGHTACIPALALYQLKLTSLSVVDELNAQAQVALSFVFDRDCHAWAILQIKPASNCSAAVCKLVTRHA